VDIETQVKPEYEAPVVVDYGSLRELTAAAKTGTSTDATFPAHTLLANETFSTP
jgi:hypothetical protein